MQTMDSGHSLPRGATARGEKMLQPDEVAAMMRLHGLAGEPSGLRTRSAPHATRFDDIFARVVRCPFRRPARRSVLDGFEGWLRKRFFRHGGNADVIRQELLAEHGVVLSLRHVERRVAGLAV